MYQNASEHQIVICLIQGAPSVQS